MKFRRMLAAAAATACLMTGSASLAESNDFSAMTDAELIALIEAAQTELDSRAPKAEKRVFTGEIFSEDGYTLSINGVSGMEYEQKLFLMIDVTAENNSEYNIEIDLSFESFNDWDVRQSMVSEAILVSAGKKATGQMMFILPDIGVTSLEEIESFEYEISVWDKDRSPFNLYRTDILTGVFE